MRRFALLAAYTAIALFRPGPASGADALWHVKGLTQARLDVACDGKMLMPQGLKFHTCK